MTTGLQNSDQLFKQERGIMKIFFDNDVSKEVKFDDYFLENGFLETFYEWCDFNGIDIEFDENGG